VYATSALRLGAVTFALAQDNAIVAEDGDPPFIGRTTMSHQPPKQHKKKALLTPKEKKAQKRQKKHASDVAPFIKT
jgi:hypothetical protein